MEKDVSRPSRNLIQVATSRELRPAKPHPHQVREEVNLCPALPSTPAAMPSGRA